jgi:hypothetical protein
MCSCDHVDDVDDDTVSFVVVVAVVHVDSSVAVDGLVVTTDVTVNASQ